MAQAKRKRRTKHRGNAAGMVEVRGRTGRKPRADERKANTTDDAARRREERLNRVPSWRSAANRAAFTALIFGVAVYVFFDRALPQAAALAGFMFLLYIPLGYYTDHFVYRRRHRRRQTKA